MKSIITLALLTLGMLQGFAADFRVRGTVTDSLGEPEMYATVKIFSTADSVKPVATAVTNDKGLFNRALKSAGSYRLNIYTVGKTPVDIPFTLTEAKPVAHLGKITLREAASMLSTVEVVATKPLVSVEVDRIGYDVQADDEAKTSMTDDILRKVPLVSVESDGTIKVNGSTDFKIYKNGRPNSAYSNNAKEIFKGLPASMIEKIEVITEPGAREDAEGVSAILNIVTVKNLVTKGAMGSIGLRYTTPQYVPAPNAFISAQYDKVTVSAFGGATFNNSRSTRSISEGFTEFTQTGNYSSFDNSASGRSTFTYWGVEGSWEPDTLNLITLEVFRYASRNKSWTHGSNTLLDAAGNLLYSYRTRGVTSPSTWSDMSGSLNYQRNTSRKGENIVFSYKLNDNSSGSDADQLYYDAVNMPVPYDGIITRSRASGAEHTVQIDWNRPFAKVHNIDVGGKYIYRLNHSKSHQEYINYRDVSTNFKHNTQIGALFADYRLNLGKFGARAGLRYEFSHLSVRYPDGSGTPFSTDLNDWVPNVGVIYNPTRSNSLKLSFGSRIQRPGIWYLNPTVNESPNYTSFGNPDLESVRKNSLTLNYNYMSVKTTVGFTANYSFSSNDIINVQTVEGNHVTSTYANLGRLREFSTSLYANWRPTRKTSLMMNAGLDYSHQFNPATGETACGWGGRGFLRVAQTLPWELELTASLSTWFNPRQLHSLYRNTSWSCIYYGISLRKNFLKENRLSASINISNPIHAKNPGSISKTWADGYFSRTQTYRKYYSTFSVSVSYRFGKMNSSVKKTARSITNDDVMGGGENSGGSSGGN